MTRTQPTVTILGYHAIEDGPSPICISPTDFERQVKALHESGCVALTVTEVAERIREGRPFPQRAVAFTFDDGYASVHTRALPLLESLGYRATVYPVTSQLGGSNRWDLERGSGHRLAVVGRSQVRELAAAGWEVGGHTHTHADLRQLSAPDVQREIDTSTAILEDLCSHAVRTFAYPYGHNDAASRSLAAARHSACLVIGASKAGLGAPLEVLPRVDAWYLRRTWQVRHIHGRSGDAYLALRRLGRAAGVRVRGGR
jgi:peptidoglycan/xylan/chitin deacetylase (PgdA/CDA1 family)